MSETENKKSNFWTIVTACVIIWFVVYVFYDDTKQEQELKTDYMQSQIDCHEYYNSNAYLLELEEYFKCNQKTWDERLFCEGDIHNAREYDLWLCLKWSKDWYLYDLEYRQHQKRDF